MSGKKSTIPTNHNTNKQDDTRALLKQIEAQYNQHVYKYKHYKASIWNQKPMEDLPLYLKGLLRSVKISLNSIQCTEKYLQLENTKIPNKLLLLKIHLMILIARLYVSMSHSKPQKHKKALSMFFAIMLEFIKNTKTPYIKNSLNQKEIVYALRMISRYGDAKELPHYNVTAWALARCAIEKQYNDGFDKLDAYGSICDFTQNPKLNTLALRRDFFTIFEAMDKEYCRRLADNKLNLIEKLDYLNAMSLIYEATVKNNPTVTRTTVTNCIDKKSYSIEPATKFLIILLQEYENYLPKIDSLRKTIDMDELVEDLDYLANYHYFVARFYKFIQSQLKDLLYLYNYLEHANVPPLRNKIFDFIVKIRRFFIDFHAGNIALNDKMQEALMTLSLFRENVQDANTKSFIIGNWLDNNELTNFITLHSKATEQLIKTQDSAIKTSNETMEKLISQPNKALKIREKTQKPSISQKSKTNNPSIKEKKEPICNQISVPLSESLHYCEQGALMIANKNYEKASFHFDLSYKKAISSEEKLHALDGLIFSIQQDVLRSLMQIKLEYDFSDNTIKGTDSIISNGINNLLYLDTLYNHFKQLTMAIEKTTVKEKLVDIVYGNDILRDDYLKIKGKVNQLYMIKDKRMAEKNKKHKSLTSKAQSVTPTLTIAPKKTIQPSDFPPLEIHPIQTTKTREVQLPQALNDVFDFLNQVKGEHYLVGSMVLRLLQEDCANTIQPSDLDFLSLHSKSEDWIKNGHFMQITEERHLFKLTRWCDFRPFLPLEVWLDDEKEDLNKCLLTRDFTVAALACSDKGIIIDPTGMGFDDLKNKRLRMIGLPEIRFQESPSILLRVIKYIVLGFKPDKAIIDAMHLWQPTQETNRAKLHVLCEKIFLASADKLAFAYHLKAFQLLGKLFDFTKDASTEEVLVFLENKGVKSNSTNKNGFFQKQESLVCVDFSCKVGNLSQL